MTTSRPGRAALGAAVLVAALPVYAQDAETDSPPFDDVLALGLVSIPEFEGAGDQQTVPLVYGQINFEGYRYLAIEGTGARLNLVDRSDWAAGPSVNFGFGRDEDVENDVIALMEEVDTAIEVGAFLSRTWQGVGHPSGSLSAGVNLLQDVAGAHDGWQAQFNVGYARSYGTRWRLTTNVGATWVDDSFAETYFGVSSADAARSGLAGYQADGGLKDYGVNVIANYQFTERWSAVGYASFRRLAGDAVDSPIVDQEGDPNQVILALGIGYSF
ncbi:MAG: MipA/OmpV family protein [Pseudomonadota bacterium]